MTEFISSWRIGSRSRTTAQILAVAIGSVALGGLVVVLPRSGDVMARSVPLLLVLVTLGLGLTWERAERHLGVLSPLVLASAIYAIMFALVPLADVWLDHPSLAAPAWWYGAWLGWIGAILLVVGYRMSFTLLPVPGRAPPRKWSPLTADVLSAGLLAIAVAATLLALGGVGGAVAYFAEFGNRGRFAGFEQRAGPQILSSTFAVAISCAVPAVLLQGASWISRPTVRRAAVLLCLFLPSAIVASGFIGARWRVLALVLALIALYHFGRRKLPPMLIVATFAALILAFVVWGQQRSVLGTERSAPSISGQGFYYNYIASTHEASQFRDFVTTLGGVGDVIPYQHGRTFLSIIPGAPFETGGEVFTETFFPVTWDGGSSIPTPFPGELYLNFGLPGLVLGMLLFGSAVGLIERYYLERNDLSALVLYCYSILPVALILRGDFTTFTGFYLLGLLILVVGIRFVTRRGSMDVAT